MRCMLQMRERVMVTESVATCMDMVKIQEHAEGVAGQECTMPQMAPDMSRGLHCMPWHLIRAPANQGFNPIRNTNCILVW